MSNSPLDNILPTEDLTVIPRVSPGPDDKPMQLVKPDLTHKKLVIVEENVKVSCSIFQ